MIDTKGNRISVINGEIQLHLSGSKVRRIGRINDASQTLYVKRKREKHLLHKANAYGFNHYVIENAKRFVKIHLEDEWGHYLIPLYTIKSHGSFLHFDKQGFEKQIFLNLNYIEKFKIITESL